MKDNQYSLQIRFYLEISRIFFEIFQRKFISTIFFAEKKFPTAVRSSIIMLKIYHIAHYISSNIMYYHIIKHSLHRTQFINS